MIIVRVRGGLGNQFFQYACARRLALRHGTRLKIDPSLWQVEYRSDRPLRLWDFTIDADIATADDLNTLGASRLVREDPFSFHPSVLRLPDDTILSGYWQSERYFADAAVVVKRELQFRDTSLAERARASVAGVRRDGGAVVAVHVRRGDYTVEGNDDLFHVLSAGWYQKAMDLFPSDSRFLVFSDDIPWCRANLQRPGLVYAEGGSDLADFALMRACDHYIMANSSFSWWAAYLSDNEDARVVAPTVECWFGARLADHDPTYIIPDRWTRLPDVRPAPSEVRSTALPEPIPVIDARLSGLLIRGAGVGLRVGIPADQPPVVGPQGLVWHGLSPDETLDGWRARTGRRHVHLVSTDPAAWARAALAGGEDSLRNARIDNIIFHLGDGAPADIAVAVAAQLTRHGYQIYRVKGHDLSTAGRKPAELLSQPGTALAVQRRLLALIGASPARELDLGVLCWSAGITPRGVIHVDANAPLGDRPAPAAYQRLGDGSVLWVRFDPVAGTLATRPGNDAAPPPIVPVPQPTLDGLAQQVDLGRYNLLHLDAGGGEERILRDAVQVLGRVDAIRIRLNFTDGATPIETIDTLLAAYGFQRKDMLSGVESGWAEGFYHRVPAG